MPIKSKHHCNYIGCPELTSQAYCPQHALQKEQQYQNKKKEYEAKRDSATKRGYTATWQKVRMMKLARNPLCERCYHRNLIQPAEIVHHVDGNPRNNVYENLMSLCNRCHEKISYKQGQRWKQKI